MKRIKPIFFFIPLTLIFTLLLWYLAFSFGRTPVDYNSDRGVTGIPFRGYEMNPVLWAPVVIKNQSTFDIWRGYATPLEISIMVSYWVLLSAVISGLIYGLVLKRR